MDRTLSWTEVEVLLGVGQIDMVAGRGSQADTDGLDLGSTAPQMTGDGEGAPADEAELSQRQDLKEMCLVM